MRSVCAGLLVLSSWVCAACADAPRSWVRVARDPNYDIFLDTARIFHRVDGTVEVYYRTIHAAPRLHKDQEFDREIVRSIVDCKRTWFKVAAVDMTLGEQRLVARQRTDEFELAQQPWRRIGEGSTEQMAAEAACHFAERRMQTRLDAALK